MWALIYADGIDRAKNNKITKLKINDEPSRRKRLMSFCLETGIHSKKFGTGNWQRSPDYRQMWNGKGEILHKKHRRWISFEWTEWANSSIFAYRQQTTFNFQWLVENKLLLCFRLYQNTVSISAGVKYRPLNTAKDCKPNISRRKIQLKPKQAPNEVVSFNVKNSKPLISSWSKCTFFFFWYMDVQKGTSAIVQLT